MRHTQAETAIIQTSLSRLLQLENIIKNARAIESGQRGFIISGEEAFLRTYRSGLDRIAIDTTQLKSLPVKEGKEKNTQQRLLKEINAKIIHSQRSIDIYRAGGFDSARAVIVSKEGLRTMNEIESLVFTLETADRNVLYQSNVKRQDFAKESSQRLYLIAFIFLFILGILYFLINRFIKTMLVSQQQLHFNASLIRNISDPVITSDNEGRITNWNSYAEELYGYTEEEVKNKPGKDILKLNVSDPSIVHFMQQMDLHDHFKDDLVHFHKDGTPIYVEVASSIIKDDHGKRLGVVSVIRDRTESRKAEMQLKRLTTNLEEEVKIKTAELTHVFERITDAFIALDNDWNYTYLNQKAAEMGGKKTIQELLGKNIWREYPDVMNEPFYEALLRAKSTGKEQRLELYYSKVDCWYEDLIYPSKDGISVYYHDITKRKKAEIALEQSNERFLLVARATNEAIWDWDLATDVIWGNDAFNKIFNLAPDDNFSWEKFQEKVHKDDLEHLLENFRKSVNEGQTLVEEVFRYRAKDGSYRILDDKAYLIFDDAGQAIRMLGAMRDITEEREAQEKLVLEKQLSDSIINSLPAIFYLYNKEGKFYRWNKRFEEVTGYSTEEVASYSPLQYFAEKDHALLSERIGDVFVNGEAHVEADLRTKDGRMIPYYFGGKEISYEGETCLVGCGIDISERVESQKQLQQNEEKFRTLIEQASDGIFISNFRGEYIDVNSNGLKLSGYTMEELKNLTIYDLIPPGDEDSNPIKMEELFGGNVVINERRMRCKDGSIVNVEISAKLLTDGRFLGIVRDITTRKKAEEALKLSEEKYRLLFYQNPMPMWMISVPERNFLDVNSAAMDFYGYSKEEFLSMNIMDIRPPEEIQPVKRAINNMPKGINRAGTWTHLKKDGTRIRVSIISHDIMYEGKAAKLILANDVSERLLAEEKLQESHEAFRQLATHLETVREAERTHMAREIHDELGQQLTGLKMDISWLNKKIKTDDQEVQQKIQETILLIDSTVKSVRRIATELRPSILDDLGLVAAMEWHSEEFEKRFKISCIFESKVTNEKIPPGLTTGIFRIYQECLTNVLRHSEASEVRSFLDIVDDKLRLQITDNGKGFIVEEIANKKTLGLLGMKERASLMGGTYEIFSNPGKGTSILIIVSLNSN
jgi:PAS domain S-box-containing protein